MSTPANRFVQPPWQVSYDRFVKGESLSSIAITLTLILTLTLTLNPKNHPNHHLNP